MSKLKLLDGVLNHLWMPGGIERHIDSRKVAGALRVALLPFLALEKDVINHVLLVLGCGSQAASLFGFLVFTSGHTL